MTEAQLIHGMGREGLQWVMLAAGIIVYAYALWAISRSVGRD